MSVRINIRVEPYLARFARVRWPGHDGVVVLPRGCPVTACIEVFSLCRPSHAKPEAGNLLLEIPERDVAKDLRRYNYLSERGRKQVEWSLRTEFLRVLHETMDRERYRSGREYQDTAEAFHRYYGLGDTLTVDALLKMHQRWKEQQREWKGRPEQLEINFNDYTK